MSVVHLDQSRVLLVVQDLDALNVAIDAKQREQSVRGDLLLVQVGDEQNVAAKLLRNAQSRQAEPGNAARKSHASQAHAAESHAGDVASEPRAAKAAAHGTHGAVQAGVARGQARVGVVAALVVVELDVQVGQLRVLDAQGAARVVDVLAVERQLGSLGRDDIRVLDQSLSQTIEPNHHTSEKSGY